MTRERVPILPPCAPPRGPVTVAGLLAWYAALQADRLRVFKTNILLAIAAGEIDPEIADLEDLFEEAREEAENGRAPFRQQVLSMLTMLTRSETASTR